MNDAENHAEFLSKLEEQMEHCYGICASGDANADAISGLEETAATDCREEVVEEFRGRLVRFCHLVGSRIGVC